MTIKFTYMEAEVTIQDLEIICSDQLVKDLVKELLMSRPRAAHLPDPEIATAEIMKERKLINEYEILETEEDQAKIQ